MSGCGVAAEPRPDGLLARVAELEQSLAQWQAFAASVSHELRTPLAALGSFCGLIEAQLAQLPQDEARQCERHLQRVRAGLDHLGELVSALMRLSRASTVALATEAVDLSALASEVLDALVAREPQRPRLLSVQPGLAAWGDRMLLRQLLDNLLGNAWKFSARQAQVHIEVGRQDHASPEPVFFVRDHGAGFDARLAARLFQPFERLHASADYPGTGIGLATARRIVERHGGKIWAAAADPGAVFFFTLGARPVPEATRSV